MHAASEVGQLTVNEMELEVGKGAVTVQMKLPGQSLLNVPLSPYTSGCSHSKSLFKRHSTGKAEYPRV